MERRRRRTSLGKLIPMNRLMRRAMLTAPLLLAAVPASAQAPANIIGISFVDIASTRMANLQATMDAVIGAENGILNPILRALFMIYIGRQFLLCMAGDLSMQRFFSTIMRSGIIILLVTHNGAFVQYVRDPVFNKIPQAMSNMVAGNYAALPAGQPMAAQFDAIAAAGDAITSEIDKVSTNVFSLPNWINSLSGHIANGVFQLVLAIIVGIWLLGQTLLGIILAMGLPLLCFEIFERTRGFVDQWIGKLVGMAAFGFATSFVLAMEMNGMKTMFNNVKGQAVNNAALAAGMFWHVIGDAALDLLTMAVLPVAVGFGSGAVAALAAPSALLAMRSLSIAAGTAAKATTKAAGALARSARPGNTMSRSA